MDRNLPRHYFVNGLVRPRIENNRLPKLRQSQLLKLADAG